MVAFVRCSTSEPNLHDYDADDKNMNRGSLTYDRLAGHQNIFCSLIQRSFKKSNLADIPSEFSEKSLTYII